MDVNDGIAAPAAPNAGVIHNPLPGGGQHNNAAPAAPQAEVIHNHLPGGGQQNQSAHVAPVLVLGPLRGPDARRQYALDQAAAAGRQIRFRNHLQQRRPIHPYADLRLPPLLQPGPQRHGHPVPLLPGINYDTIINVPIVPLPRPTLFNWRQPALNPRPMDIIIPPHHNQHLAIAGSSGSQRPTSQNIISVDISNLPPIQPDPILDFSTPSRTPRADSPAWPPSTADRRASMRNRHDEIAQRRRSYEYRRQLANPDTDDEDMEQHQTRPVRRRQLTLDIPAYNPLSMQQRLDALRQPLSPTRYPTTAQLASSLPELEHIPYPALTYVPGTPTGPGQTLPRQSLPASPATRDRSPLPYQVLQHNAVRPERARSTSPSRRSATSSRLTRAASEESVRSQWRLSGNRAASPDQQRVR
jgi:hypothetical protein